MSELSLSLLANRFDEDTHKWVVDHIADFSCLRDALDYGKRHRGDLQNVGWQETLLIDANNPFYQGYFHTIPKEVVAKCCPKVQERIRSGC